MALVATVGGATSNSYVTTAEADTYFATRYNNSTWTALTTAQKEAALITATEQIDRLRFRYLRYGSEIENADDYQRLEFPRSYTLDIAGVAIVPLEVKKATYEQAWFVISYAAETEKRAALQAQGVKSFSTGGVENFNAPSVSETYETAGGEASASGVCSAAKRLLAAHLDNMATLYRS